MDSPGFLAYLAAGSGDNLIVDASFVKLKNVSLSYTLPRAFVQTLKLSNVRVYMQGQNLLVFTKFNGLDPEFPIPTNLPPLKVLTGGIEISI
jgi:hypothetical protein